MSVHAAAAAAATTLVGLCAGQAQVPLHRVAVVATVDDVVASVTVTQVYRPVVNGGSRRKGPPGEGRGGASGSGAAQLAPSDGGVPVPEVRYVFPLDAPSAVSSFRATVGGRALVGEVREAAAAAAAYAAGLRAQRASGLLLAHREDVFEVALGALLLTDEEVVVELTYVAELLSAAAVAAATPAAAETVAGRAPDHATAAFVLPTGVAPRDTPAWGDGAGQAPLPPWAVGTGTGGTASAAAFPAGAAGGLTLDLDVTSRTGAIGALTCAAFPDALVVQPRAGDGGDGGSGGADDGASGRRPTRSCPA